MFETVTSGVIDFFPEQLTDKRVLVNIVTGLVVFVLSLPFTLNVSSIKSGVCLLIAVHCFSITFKLTST